MGGWLGALLLLLLVAGAEARICGSQWLRQQAGELPVPRGKAASPRQQEIKLGTRLEFVVAGDAFLRPATCRYVGAHSYIFVEDLQWDIVVSRPEVERLGRLFEEATPADSTRGMYGLAVEAFGPPPDVDGDPRVFILLLDISDPRLVGFFDPRVSRYADPALRRDTVYLDAEKVAFSPYLAQGTLAHEFQHLIHWGQDEDEELWVDEGLSGYAEQLTGFPETDPSMVPGFLQQPDLDLTFWPAQARAANYGSTYLFMSFLAERYGAQLIRQVVAEPRNGAFGLDEAFRRVGLVQNFAGAWSRWIAGNYAATDELFGYGALQGRRVAVFGTPALPFGPLGGVVSRQWGTTNIIIREPGDVEVQFDGADEGRFRVWGYAMRGEQGDVVEVELDAENRGMLQVVGVDSVAVVVGRTSPEGGEFSLAARRPVPTLVAEAGGGLPLGAQLGAVYPNPFNGEVAVPFALGGAGRVELAIYDVLGRRVRMLERGTLEAGRYGAVWDGRDEGGREVGAGVYVAVLVVGERRLVSKLALVK